MGPSPYCLIAKSCVLRNFCGLAFFIPVTHEHLSFMRSATFKQRRQARALQRTTNYKLYEEPDIYNNYPHIILLYMYLKGLEWEENQNCVFLHELMMDNFEMFRSFLWAARILFHQWALCAIFKQRCQIRGRQITNYSKSRIFIMIIRTLYHYICI